VQAAAAAPAAEARPAPVPQPEARPPAPASVTDPALPLQQRVEAFVDYAVSTYGADPARVRAVLAQAEHKQSIIDAMNRPAEKVRTWAGYRPIFLNDKRIDAGVAFMAEHRDELERVSAASGVPAEYIVAIVGVETNYGRITGSYRVIDALYTLAFDYPKRAPFFAGELAQLFALDKAEGGMDLVALKGSYAGAMGWGQFMTSSNRLLGRDGDHDGKPDLLGEAEDVFASIANYFVVHGWQRGAPVVARADRSTGEVFAPDMPDPAYTLQELAQRGYTPAAGEPVVGAGEGATVFNFEGADGPEQWIGYRNFYVITRYNHSPMYAMAVHQLAQAIRAGADAAGSNAGK
jgi:membrane-bound lytic murein transglycosylase B